MAAGKVLIRIHPTHIVWADPAYAAKMVEKGRAVYVGPAPTTKKKAGKK